MSYLYSRKTENTSAQGRQLKKELLQILTKIHEGKTSEFAVGEINPELPALPGIKISGYGTVCLPVTEMTMKDLRKHFHQAPYGLGEETLIDKSVRDSWQLDPEKFEITNPRFNAGVEKLVKEIQGKLGCDEQKVTSHLYKLLLYEPGGHFKPHRDTEKHPGMFATLIIQVPSIFTGGDLVVKHGTREKKIAFGSPESKFSCMYAAHYADCEHELTEITCGYRMALVYSLCWDGNGVVPSPPDIPTNKLAGLLGQLDQVLPRPHMVAWGLDHHYSENSFHRKGIQALKGGDKHIFSTLQGANALLEDDKKVDFLIIEAKRWDYQYGLCTGGYSGSGDCFDFDGDCDTEYKFKAIGIDGKEWGRHRHFDLDYSETVLNVGKDDEEFWGECNEGECSGPSGNEGSSKTNWYRRYVLLIFPVDSF